MRNEGDPDPRLHAFRSDLADIRLKGRVEAARFVRGAQYRITAPVVDVRHGPHGGSGMDTQLLLGTDILVFERQNGYAWIQSREDGYVGYIDDSMMERDNTPHTHQVIVPRTFLYPAADLRLSPAVALSLGNRFAVIAEQETRGTRYGLLQSGQALVLSHLRPVEQPAKDYVRVAEQLVHTPYLWGGASGFGVDCSGLVQLAMAAAGKKVPRDSDMQAGTIGTVITDPDALQRGDLVFWRGHVAIMTDRTHILHANGASMTVCREAFAQAQARIARTDGPPVCLRRP